MFAKEIQTKVKLFGLVSYSRTFSLIPKLKERDTDEDDDGDGDDDYDDGKSHNFNMYAFGSVFTYECR